MEVEEIFFSFLVSFLKQIESWSSGPDLQGAHNSGLLSDWKTAKTQKVSRVVGALSGLPLDKVVLKERDSVEAVVVVQVQAEVVIS